MKQKISKINAKNKIDSFFKNIKNKTPEEVKKIKKLAMANKISLGQKRKTFCKKCLLPYIDPKTRIHKNIKSITCNNCGYVSRWKIKLS